MLYKVKSILFVLLLAGLLVACAAPATPAPVSTQPAPTLPEPTQLVPTALPDVPGKEITIPAGEGNESIKATITGEGDIAVMVHKTQDDTDTSSSWTPLVDILGANEKLRIVTYTYRSYDTSGKDARAVFEYLRAEGINRIIPICAGIAQPCESLQKEPEIIGIVLFPGDNLSPIEASFPKLFVTADAEPEAGVLKQVYERSAEPKTFKSYTAALGGPAIFLKADVGPQVIADITDFINGIVSGQ